MVAYASPQSFIGKFIIARMDDSELSHYKSLSKINFAGQFAFGESFGTKENKPLSATPDQIKQLEREEMKAGKSWNGEGYDDWLTADGLTINEIIKHGIENIQVGGEEHDTEWRRTSHGSLDGVINEMLVFVKEYRLKPQESFVDKEVIRESDVQVLLQSEEMTEFVLNFLKDLRR